VCVVLCVCVCTRAGKVHEDGVCVIHCVCAFVGGWVYVCDTLCVCVCVCVCVCR
jgi:hypothetical protein